MPNPPVAAAPKDRRFDFTLERAAYPLCLGREPLVKELDRLLFEETRTWVVLSGAPGRGKSALISAYLGHLEAASSEARPGLLSRLFGGKKAPAQVRRFAYHFLSPRLPGATQPEAVARSLCEQLAAMYALPDTTAPDAAPVERLSELLSQVSQSVLVPQGQRLILVLDGLDEAEGAELENPLPRILPESLPAGVSVLCTTRPTEPHLPWLLQRQSQHLDLDAPGFAAQNAAAVEASWRHIGASLSLPPQLLTELAQRSEGNLLHATLAQALLATLEPAQRAPAQVPLGLPALCQRLFELLQRRVGEALPLLCAAQRPLPLAWLQRLLGSAAPSLDALRPLLWPPGAPERGGQVGRVGRVGLHDAVRRHLASQLERAGEADRPLVAQHRRLAAELCPWPLPAALAQDSEASRYALRFGLLHRVLGEDFASALALARDTGYLAAKAQLLGPVALCCELREALLATPPGEATLRQLLADLYRAVGRERGWLLKLSGQPDALPGLLYNRLICLGWTGERLRSELAWPGGLPKLRLLHPLQQDGSACERVVACQTSFAPGSDGGDPGLHACAALPDGGHVLIGHGGGTDGLVELWQLVPGAEQALWSKVGHRGTVHAVLLLSPTEALTAGSDGLIKRWSLERGEVLATLGQGGSGAAVHSLALLTAGRLAAGEADGTVRIHELATGRSVGTLPSTGGPVLSCLALDDGRLATGGEDGAIRIWSLQGSTAELVATLRGHSRAVSDLRLISQNGKRLLSASLDGTLRLWQLDKLGQPDGEAALATLRGHEEGVSACAVLEREGRIVSASLDGTVRVWSLSDGATLAVLEGHAGWVTACATGGGDGEGATRRIFSVSLDGTLRLWSLAQAERLYARHGHKSFVTALSLSPTGRQLVSASRDRTLKVWDTQSGEHLHTLSGHAAAVDECAVLPDGQRVASASHDATLKLWDLQSGQALTTLHGHSSWVSSCVPLPDGERIVSAALDGTLRVWNARNGQAIRSLSGHTDSITACAVLPDGQRVVSASADGTLRLWNLQSGEQLATLHGHTASVDRCAVLPDGECLLSASADGTLKLWQLGTGKLLRTFEGHSAWLSGCAVLPGGERVLSASGDETLKVWELASGRLVANLTGHRAAIYNCAALPDGRHVVSVSGDGMLKLWDAASGACLATLYGSDEAGFFSVVAGAAGSGRLYAGDIIGNIWMLEYEN